MMVKLQAFLQKYSWQVHAVLVVWNSFIVSWATGISVPLDSIGIPISLNARAVVVYIQAHIHIPTWAVAVATFAFNASLAYMNWKKAHPDVTLDAIKDKVEAADTNVQQVSVKLETAQAMLDAKKQSVDQKGK